MLSRGRVNPVLPPVPTVRRGLLLMLLATAAFVGMSVCVKQLREARSLTQEQISRSSGLPRATWANVESGAANPTLAVLHKLAHALSVSFEELLVLGFDQLSFFVLGLDPVGL